MQDQLLNLRHLDQSSLVVRCKHRPSTSCKHHERQKQQELIVLLFAFLLLLFELLGTLFSHVERSSVLGPRHVTFAKVTVLGIGSHSRIDRFKSSAFAGGYWALTIHCLLLLHIGGSLLPTAITIATFVTLDLALGVHSVLLSVK